MNYNLYVYHFCQSFLIVLERVLRDENEYNLIYVSNWREWNGRDGHAYPVCEKVNRPCLDVSEKGELWHSDFYIFPWQPRECVVCSWQPTSTPHQVHVVACWTQQTNQQCQQNKCERPQNKITRRKSDV